MAYPASNPFAKYSRVMKQESDQVQNKVKVGEGVAEEEAVNKVVEVEEGSIRSPVTSWPKAMRTLYQMLVSRKGEYIKKNPDLFQEVFPKIFHKPFCTLDAGETPATAPLLRLDIASVTLKLTPGQAFRDLQATTDWSKFLKYLAWWTFSQGDVSETYRTDSAIKASLDGVCTGWGALLRPMMQAGALVPHPEFASQWTTCLRREEEQAVTTLMSNASSLLAGHIHQVQQAQDLSDEQVACLKDAMQRPWYLLRGGPGRGKSRVVATLTRIARQAADMDVILAAPSHKAANILRASLIGENDDNVEIMTVQKLATKGRLRAADRQHKRHAATATATATAIPAKTRGLLIIVDEASMVCLSDLAGIGEYALSQPSAYQLLFVGDEMQLPPIEAGEVFRHALQSYKAATASLTKCFRTESVELMAFIDGIARGSLAFPETSDIINFSISSEPINAAIDAYTAGQIDIIISPCNDTRKRINEGIQEFCFLPSSALATKFGKFKKFHIGEPVIYVKSDPPSEAMGWLRNGMMGTVREIVDGGRGVCIDWMLGASTYRMRLFNYRKKDVFLTRQDVWSPFADGIELAYCITGHKSQGSEYDRVAIVMDSKDTWTLSKAFDRRWLYTAASRSKKALTIICKDAAALRQAVASPIRPMHPLLIVY